MTSKGCDESESDDSNEVEATACQTPQNLKAKAANNEIELKWSPSLGATSYTVSRTPAWSYTNNFSDSTQDTHFVDTMVQDSVTYTYQVRAVVSCEEQTSLSLPASATPAGLVTNLTAVEATNGIQVNRKAPGPISVICAAYSLTGTKVGSDRVPATAARRPRLSAADRRSRSPMQGRSLSVTLC